MNLTIRNIPDDVISKIRTLSSLERRSLNNEILILLECGLREVARQLAEAPRTINKNTQVSLWKRLGEEWRDDRDTAEIIADIYSSRTVGREFEI